MQNIKSYLDNLDQKRKSIDTDLLLCSSDIIERYSGKFKQKICQNSPHKMTEFIFTIANFSNQFSQEETQNALEFITVKEVKKVKNKVPF